MTAHRRDARLAPGPRPGHGPRVSRTTAALFALNLLVCATLVVVYRDAAGALRRAVGLLAGVARLSQDPPGAAAQVGDGDGEQQQLDRLDLESSILRVPRPNSWDDRRPSTSELQLEERLRNATDAGSRARALERIVHASYCGFQVVHGNSSTLRDDLARLRLDRPVLLTHAARPVRRWTAEHLISRYADAEVTVLTMPEGADALLPYPEYVAKHLSGSAPPGGLTAAEAATDKVLLYAQRRMRLRAFAERCAGGDARNLIVANGLIGERFGVLYAPWLDGADACAPIAAGVEDAAWSAGIPQQYVAGPWADATRRLREWVRYAQRAPSAEDRDARVRAFDAFRKRSRMVDGAAYVRDALGLSGREMRERWAAPEGSYTTSPVLFMGQHLSGLYAHSHQRAAQLALRGYRVWYVRRPADRGKADVKRTFASAFDHFTRVASFDLAADSRERVDAVCSQPPGSMVLLPESWTHSVLGWAEDDHGRPAPLDRAGGMTVSMSWQ